jgi:hypothetical protein
MAKYMVRRRRNFKPRFDFHAFAKDQDVSLDWIFDGDLMGHPRGTSRGSSSVPRRSQQVPSAAELKKRIDGLDENGQQFMKGYIQALVDCRTKTDDPG